MHPKVCLLSKRSTTWTEVRALQVRRPRMKRSSQHWLHTRRETNLDSHTTGDRVRTANKRSLSAGPVEMPASLYSEGASWRLHANGTVAALSTGAVWSASLTKGGTRTDIVVRLFELGIGRGFANVDLQSRLTSKQCARALCKCTQHAFEIEWMNGGS